MLRKNLSNVLLGGIMMSIAAVGAEPEILFQQKDEVLKVCNGVTEEVADTVIRVELKSSKVAALRISGEVKTTGVTEPTGDSLLIVTNGLWRTPGGEKVLEDCIRAARAAGHDRYQYYECASVNGTAQGEVVMWQPPPSLGLPPGIQDTIK